MPLSPLDRDERCESASTTRRLGRLLSDGCSLQSSFWYQPIDLIYSVLIHSMVRSASRWFSQAHAGPGAVFAAGRFHCLAPVPVRARVTIGFESGADDDRAPRIDPSHR
jgi:hypothetical protein